LRLRSLSAAKHRRRLNRCRSQGWRFAILSDGTGEVHPANIGQPTPLATEQVRVRERWAQLILSQKRSTLLRLRAYPLRVCSNSGFWPKAKVKIAQMNVRCLRERAGIELLAAVAGHTLMMRGRIALPRNGLFRLGGYSDVDR